MNETEPVIIEKDDKDWDGRPDNVCQKCGYHTCCCKLQNPESKIRKFNYRELLNSIRDQARLIL